MVNLDEDRFQRHSLGQILGRSLGILRQEFWSFLALSLLLSIPTAFLNAMALPRFQQFQQEMDEAMSQAESDPHQAQAMMEHVNAEMLAFFQHWWWVFLALALVGAVVKAAIIRTAAQSFVQQTVTVAFNVQHGVRLLPTLIWWFVLYTFGFVVYIIAVAIVMVVLLVVVMLTFPQDVAVVLFVLLYVAILATTYYIAMILAFCLPTIVVERATATQSVVRAWTMTRGQRCLIFGTLLVLFAAALVTALVQACMVDAWHMTPASHALLEMVPSSLVFIPLGGIVITVLYIHVRIVNEGCNRDVLVKDLRESTTAGATTGGASGADTPHRDALLLDVDDNDNDNARLEEALLPEHTDENNQVVDENEVV